MCQAPISFPCLHCSFVRKHMPDREKLMQTCYTPSHGGENTSFSPKSPLSYTYKEKNNRNDLQNQTLYFWCVLQA